MDFFKNLRIRLQAVGPSAVLVSLILSIAALGIFGGENSSSALTILAGLGGGLVWVLGSRT